MGNALLEHDRHRAARMGRGRAVVSEPSAPPASSAAVSLLMAILLYVLMLEWLYPLKRLSEITDIYMIGPFAASFAFFIAIDALRMPAWGAWTLKAAFIAAVTAWLYGGAEALRLEWWAHWGEALALDAGEGLRGQASDWEPSTRTLLFLAGWSFFISVVQSFVKERQQVLWFVLLTLGYLGFIQTVFALDVLAGALRVLTAGLLLQGLVTIGGWKRWGLEPAALEAEGTKPRFAIRPREEWRLREAAPLLAIIALCTAAGWLGARYSGSETQLAGWPRFIQAFERFYNNDQVPRQAANTAKGVTGYGLDDTLLGRPLTPNPSVAFSAWTSRPTYWRGETKSEYTGRGWSEPDRGRTQNIAQAAMAVPDEAALAVRHPVEQHVLLQDSRLNRQLFAGGDVVRVESIKTASGASLPDRLIWKQSGSDRLLVPALTDPVVSYHLTALAVTDRSLLRALPEQSADAAAENGALKPYLQLPDSLPDRIRALAEQVAGGEAAALGKAEAIERFLRTNYAYTMEGTRIPAPGEDLVDLFLFEQKAGYCDHFSTAMVVMLRTLGVPARWAKGFAPGELTPAEGSAGGYMAKVRHQDAHSWAEVWLPSAGWVPFEPTPGFGEGSSGGGNQAQPAQLAADTPASASAVSADTPAERTTIGEARDWASARLADLRQAMEQAAAAAMEQLSWTREAAPLKKLPEGLAAVGIGLAVGLVAAAGAALLVLRRNRAAGAGSLASSAAASRQAGVPLRLIGLHRYGERLWGKVQRSLGRCAPFDTLREYAASRRLTGPRQRALQELTLLIETLRYDRPAAPSRHVTRRMLKEAWLRFRRGE